MRFADWEQHKSEEENMSDISGFRQLWGMNRENWTLWIRISILIFKMGS
jgi:hypothetical protein